MNYKIKVGSEAESKEAQELFFELGYKWFSGGKKAQHLEKSCSSSSSFGYLVAWSTGCFTNVIQCGCGNEVAKEITIPQLKDMVVLKRNDVSDATHTDQDNWKWFIGSDGIGYVWQCGNADNLKQWDESSLDMVDLKPITKEPVMKEYLNKLEDGTYKLVLLDSVADGVEGLIEVPEGMNYAYNDEFNIHFTKLEMGYRDSIIVWQRETLNDKVASAEVAHQEFIGVPFSDLPEFDFEAVDVVDAEFFPDNVNQPSHYCSHPSGIECIEITRHHDFAIGNAIKYLWRAGLKDSADEIQDLEKASWYIQDKINQLKKLNENSSKD